MRRLVRRLMATGFEPRVQQGHLIPPTSTQLVLALLTMCFISLLRPFTLKNEPKSSLVPKKDNLPIHVLLLFGQFLEIFLTERALQLEDLS